MKEGAFYNYAFVYMLVRITMNVTMTAQPFYLDQVCGWHPTDDNPTPVPLAVVPLCSYIMCMIFSIFLQRPLTRCFASRTFPMLISIYIIAITSIPLIFMTPGNRTWVFPLSAFQGIGIAIMLNTATSLISDVIGQDSSGGAFVYGCYSLLDRFANGILLYYIIANYSTDPDALKYVMGIIPMVCSILSYLLTYFGQKFFGHKLAKIT